MSHKNHTGGDLLYNANIRFENGDEVSIIQRYTGVDESEEGGGVIGGYVTIDGNVPNLSPGTSVTVDRHSEVYTKYRPGTKVTNFNQLSVGTG